MFNYAESIASRNTYMTSIRETMAEAQRSKPAVTISMDGDADGKSHRFYTNRDRLEGDVKIVAPADTRFDEIYITFEGTSRTWMERLGVSPAASGRTSVSQTFLRLVQPVNEASLPIPRVAIKGQEYTFPFTFVIPERLLPGACNHTIAVENQSVEEAHLHLPPSLGDHTISTFEDKDDLAPDMTRISYAIRVRVLRKKDTEDQPVVLADTARKIAVSPSIPDAPPIHIQDRSTEFVLRKEKDLRKGLLGKKIGRVCIFAEQPQPLRLAPNSSCPPSTRVPVSLTFVPANAETPPPELGNMTAKLRTSTFFSTQRTSYTPTVSRSTPDPFVGRYQESTLLSSRCVSNVSWEKQEPPPSSSSSSKPVYKAQIIVPIAEPKCKHLVPTFSTCFVTRSYTLELSLSIRTSKHSQPNLALKLPLQVSQPAKDSREHDSAPQDTSVEEFFVPRIISPSTLQQEVAVMAPPPPPPPPPFDRRQGQLPQSMLLHPPNEMPPPEYSVFRGTGGPPVRIPPPVGISPGCG